MDWTFIEFTWVERFVEMVIFVCTYVEKRNKREEITKREFVCMSAVCFLSEEAEARTGVMVVPQTNRTKRHKYDGNSLVYTYHFLSLLCVSLSFCLFKKSSCSWPTFFKKKKNTLALKIASSLDLWHVRKRADIPPLVVWLEEHHWEPNIKDWRTEREKEIQRQANV